VQTYGQSKTHRAQFFNEQQQHMQAHLQVLSLLRGAGCWVLAAAARSNLQVWTLNHNQGVRVNSGQRELQLEACLLTDV
jgi:hypothetical protein